MLLWILGVPTSQIQENTLISHCYRICKLNKTYCKYLKSAATSWGGLAKDKTHFKLSEALSYYYKKLFTPRSFTFTQKLSPRSFYNSLPLISILQPLCLPFPEQDINIFSFATAGKHEAAWPRCCTELLHLLEHTVPKMGLGCSHTLPLFKQITCNCPMHLTYPKITQS